MERIKESSILQAIANGQSVVPETNPYDLTVTCTPPKATEKGAIINPNNLSNHDTDIWQIAVENKSTDTSYFVPIGTLLGLPSMGEKFGVAKLSVDTNDMVDEIGNATPSVQVLSEMVSRHGVIATAIRAFYGESQAQAQIMPESIVLDYNRNIKRQKAGFAEVDKFYNFVQIAKCQIPLSMTAGILYEVLPETSVKIEVDILGYALQENFGKQGF